MDINQLLEIVKKKILIEAKVENIKIEDKSFLHKNHKFNDLKKFHLKITIQSVELKKLNKLESTKLIYKILDYELKNYIHSIQIILI